MSDDNGVGRSLFLAGLMIVSVMVGVLYFDIEQEGLNLAPEIEGDIPNSIIYGSVDSLHLSISDEEMSGLTVAVTLDGQEIDEEIDADGNLVIDISGLGVGSHAVKVDATDSLGQESKWTAAFSIDYPDEGYTVIVVSSNEVTIERGNGTTLAGVLVHQKMDTCELEWSDGDIEVFSLNLPFDEEGRFELSFSDIQENMTISVRGTCGTWVDSIEIETLRIVVTEPEPEPARGCTDSEANNYDSEAEENDGSCTYDEPVVETGSDEWWSRVLHCDGVESSVDDYNTTGDDEWVCTLSFETNETHIQIDANGLPNHDFHSGPGCCASEQDTSWIIPLEPTNQTGCNPATTSEGCTMAPERGAVAFAVNGVAIYGPEDGPGGDAVAGQEGAYEEDRQHIWLGLCHGHSGPGGEYHYHADGNCMHWHPEGEQTWIDYSLESSRSISEHSPIIGFAFDGYPIYGFVGWDEEGEVAEMTSSYRLKEGETGYNGIDDYEYVEGLGDLDSCNGHWGTTPDYPDGTYHYHTTWENGEGGIGFPYFINCYRGVMEAGNTAAGGGGGDDPDCSGHGETWGPGIGPPPPGCGGGSGGGQQASGEEIAVPNQSKPPIIGSAILMVLALRGFTGLASGQASPSPAGRVREYRLTQG